MSIVTAAERLAAPLRRSGRVHAILWLALLVLAAAAAVAEPARSHLLQNPGRGAPSLGDALAWSGGVWLLGTLPVLLAAALAVFVGQRTVVQSALGVTASMVAGSTLIEVVGIAARPSLDFLGRAEAATTYALSSTLLACAWLTVRGWRPLALLASLLAGLASWFTIPAVIADYPVGDLLGPGTLAMYVTFVEVYALEVLVIGVATLTVLAWRRLRPSAPLKHVTHANQSHTTSPDVVAH